MADYYISIETLNVGIRAGVNGAPLFVDDGGDGLKSVRPINEWLMPGDNKLTVTLFWATGREYTPGTASVTLSVWIADPAIDAPTPLKVLATFTWPPPKPLPETYPMRLALPFIVPTPVPPMRLHTAEPIEKPTDADLDAIFSRVRELHDALAASNPDAAVDLQPDKFADDSAANGTDPARVRAAAAGVYRMVLEQSELRTTCVTRNDMLLTACCENRLRHVGRLSQTSAIVVEGSELRLRIEVFVAKINGEWRILR